MHKWGTSVSEIYIYHYIVTRVGFFRFVSECVSGVGAVTVGLYM